MRPYSYSLVILWSSVASTDAFVPRPANTHVVRTPHLSATSPTSPNESHIVVNTLEDINVKVKGALSGLALAASLWAAPAMIAPMATYIPMTHSGYNNVIVTSVANAKEMASGTGTRVNKDPESLLRYGLPINNKEVCIIL
jgi:hypothetical protein